MHLKGLFKKENQPVRHQNQAEAPNVPDGLYTKCESCHEMILTEDFTQNAYVCPKCGQTLSVCGTPLNYNDLFLYECRNCGKN